MKISCIIVKDGKLLSSGFNSEKSHPLQSRYNKVTGCNWRKDDKTHAEVKAISRCYGIDIEGATLYTFRMNKQFQLCNSRPCSSCLAAMVDNSITDFVYTTEEGFYYEQI